MAVVDETPPLLRLPPELLFQVLSLLAPLNLAYIARTCTALREISYDDRLWQALINANLRTPITDPTPCPSFRDLYIAHQPHWFLPKHQIWFADTVPTGKLIITRFDSKEGCIMGYAVVAARWGHSLYRWEKDPRVIIHSFDPHVSLDLDRPVIKLSVDSTRTDDQPNNYPSDRGYSPSSKYSKETLMDVSADSGLYSSLMLCRTLPPSGTFENTGVWPPLSIPAAARARNETRNGYESSGHRPSMLDEVSSHNFRVRKWVEYNGRRSSSQRVSFNPMAALGLAGSYFSATLRRDGYGQMNIRMPEDIATYATLPRECYAPTPEKPWQGIWCGDYSGHGCEFILILQPDREKERPLPEGMQWLAPWFQSHVDGPDTEREENEEEVDGPTEPLQAAHNYSVSKTASDESDTVQPPQQPATASSSAPHTTTDYSNAPSGRLEAIKLTGDPNIPRGEYTFIAPNIGGEGFLRVADEELFRGARIVKSAGHIAERGFRNGMSLYLRISACAV